jgi:hypothetical protein
MSKSKKLIPVGIGDFKQLIDNDYVYVDKTLLIQELISKGEGKVALIPRQRRCGKTLNLSMLRYFFEKTEKDTSYLFRPFKIWQDKIYRKLQGKFPVIFISLKDVKHASWQETLESLRGLLAQAFRSHPYLLKDSVLDDAEKELYRTILYRQGSQPLCEESLYLLTQWLYRYHKEPVVLLIDEYDAPAHAAYVGGYYDQLIAFLRNWLSRCLKDSSLLKMGVLTGILRIAKESIFSGLNNVNTYTLLNESFRDKFGLTEPEVKDLLDEYELSDKWEAVRQWYNGYRIGSCDGIYNPWSVLKCIDEKGVLATYWVNTSDNALIKQLLTQGTDLFKMDIEELLKGNTIEKTIDEGIVFARLKTNADTLWSLLLFSGYLALAKTAVFGTPCQLRIPNREVETLYKSMILDWFKETIEEARYQQLLKSLTTGDIATFSEILQKFLLSSFSVFDVSTEESEKVYHSLVLGMLIGLIDRYEVRSNRESGLGRYDVSLIPKNPQELGLVMEFKKVSLETGDLESACAAALQQIKERQYDVELRDRGIKRILHLGLAFQGKKVLIRSQAA